MEITKSENKLKSGLVLWADAHSIKPVDFAKTMGYAYATAWDLLRGKRPFTTEALGRFAVAYGWNAASELMKLADLPDGIDVNVISVDGGKIVPTVTINARIDKSKLAPSAKRVKHITTADLNN